jgi:hypothetical protein
MSFIICQMSNENDIYYMYMFDVTWIYTSIYYTKAVDENHMTNIVRELVNFSKLSQLNTSSSQLALLCLWTNTSLTLVKEELSTSTKDSVYSGWAIVR